MRFTIVSLAIIFNIIFFSCSYAKEVTIDATGEYTIGDSESKLIGKQRAIDEAMRYASEKACVYVESYSKTNNGSLTEDEIKVISSSLLKMLKEPVIETTLTKNGNLHIIAKINVVVNTDDVENILINNLTEKHKLEDNNKKLEEERVKNNQEIRRLNSIIETNKNVNNRVSEDVLYYRYTTAFEKALNATNKGDVVNAIKLFTEATRLRPNHGAAFLNRANLFAMIKEYDKAINDCMVVIRLNNCNNIENAYNILGWININKKEYDKAIYNYNKAISINPNCSLSYANRALVYKQLGNMKQAIADSSLAIDYDYKNIEAYRTRGSIYEEMRKYDQAIKDYSSIINLKHNDYTAYESRGRVYMFKEMYTEAMDDLNKCIINNPNDAYLYFVRGAVYEYSGDYNNAYIDYKKAVSLDNTREVYNRYLKNIKTKFK